MVIWDPQAARDIRRLERLNLLCRRMGAPNFLSEAEAYQWLQGRLDSLDAYYGQSTDRIILAFREAGLKLFGSLLKALRELQRRRVRSALKEQLKRNHFIKSIYKPLQVIPQSLHPNEFAA